MRASGYFLVYLSFVFSVAPTGASAEWMFQGSIQTCYKHHRAQMIELAVADEWVEVVPSQILARHGLTSGGQGMNSSQFSFRTSHNGIGPLTLGPFLDSEEADLATAEVQSALVQELCMDHPLCRGHFFTFSSAETSDGLVFKTISRLLCAHQSNIEKILSLETHLLP